MVARLGVLARSYDSSQETEGGKMGEGDNNHSRVSGDKGSGDHTGGGNWGDRGG